MLKCTITQGTGGRIIQVNATDLQRYALHDSKDIPLKWKAIGGQAVAVAHGKVKVYHKPSTMQFHREYMTHNGRSLWLGFHPDFTRLARNMYEYEGEI